MNCPSCDKNISDHEANRCLDAWVAEAVMELEVRITDDAVGESFPVIPDEHGSYYAGHAKCLESPAPFYSTDISASWRVVERMRRQYILLPIWELAFLGDFPLRVCRAALKEVSNEL